MAHALEPIILLLNIALIAGLVLNRKLLSPEGMAAAVIGGILAVRLIRVLTLDPNEATAAVLYEPVYPGILHLFGMATLWLGLWISDPHPQPIRRQWVRSNQKSGPAIQAGIALVVLAIVMLVVFMVSEDIW